MHSSCVKVYNFHLSKALISLCLSAYFMIVLNRKLVAKISKWAEWAWEESNTGVSQYVPKG